MVKLAYEVPLEELIKQENIDQNKILNEYFTPNNIGLKTEINTPVEFTNFEVIADKFNELIIFGTFKGKKRKFRKTQKTLKLWKDYFKVNMVSFQRKSRNEVGAVLKANKEQESNERSLWSKLTGLNKG